MPRILVIDDEQLVRSFLKKALEKHGYEVTEASDGLEGINKQRESPADLIISDIVMPEKDGFELMMELRGNFAEVKIIAMTGGGAYGVMGHLEVAKRLGAYATLQKPFSIEILLKTVSGALKQ
jgi:two-component system, chemotaxis family, chemotaxis protein CheY